jgi:hypothetical protein
MLDILLNITGKIIWDGSLEAGNQVTNFADVVRDKIVLPKCIRDMEHLVEPNYIH